MREIIISPSMVCADLSQLGQQVKLLDDAGVDMFHWDIMDGVFVQSFCLTPDIIAASRPFTKLPFDVHMCISDPEAFIPMVADTGADIISLQFETTPHLPKTPLSQIELILGEIQMVTVMTVDVGFAGQNFILPMLDKIRQLREMIVKNDYDVDIQVDGQINFGTFKQVIEVGANVLVVGTSGLFNVDKDVTTGVQIVKDEIASIVQSTR